MSGAFIITNHNAKGIGQRAWGIGQRAWGMGHRAKGMDKILSEAGETGEY